MNKSTSGTVEKTSIKIKYTCSEQKLLENRKK
jgi:hypothetical protein